MATGDIRSERIATTYDTAFKLSCLHHITNGVQQLHQRRIAHQDLKPSNVLIYNDRTSKIGDLGRAIDGNDGSIFDDLKVSGDKNYAPPELLYSLNPPSQWEQHRFGCDLYQLGSMVVYLFIDVHMNALLRSHLHMSHYVENWSGSFKDILPHLITAFERSLTTFYTALERDVPHPLALHLSEIVKQLCYPNVEHRGHPTNLRLRTNVYSLERYVSRFELLATAANYNLIQSLKTI